MHRFLVLLVAVACDKDADHDSGHDHAGHSDICSSPGETFTAGMTHSGDADLFAFEITEANPTPPDKGDNVWTIRITDLDSLEPVTGATVLATPFMPDHGHTPTEYAVNETKTDGVYMTETIDLIMSGLWDITLTATTSDGTSDATTFSFCLEG